jgi:hypothetical protein
MEIWIWLMKLNPLGYLIPTEKITYINRYDLILVHALDAISKVILSGTVRASPTKKERK